MRLTASTTADSCVCSYCQGMAFVASILLMTEPEEDAFWMLVALLDSPVHLHDYYTGTLKRIQVTLPN